MLEKAEREKNAFLIFWGTEEQSINQKEITVWTEWAKIRFSSARYVKGHISPDGRNQNSIEIYTY